MTSSDIQETLIKTRQKSVRTIDDWAFYAGVLESILASALSRLDVQSAPNELDTIKRVMLSESERKAIL